jgi:acyl dehydratase
MAIPMEALLKLRPEQMLEHDEFPTIEQLRNKKQLYFDDVTVGMELPKYVRKRSVVEFMRYSGVTGNTHRLHYDYPHSHNRDKLPGVLFGGQHRRSIITSWLKNWTLPDGWLWKLRWQVREMVVAGEVTILWGNVTGKRVVDGVGLVDLEFGIRTQDDVESNPGSATVALPVRGGRPVPYPFTPPQGG